MPHEFDFEWDPGKAGLNRKKHGVSFEVAASVFRDPRAMSMYDAGHSEKEDRWVTVGLSTTGGLLVVHHTWKEIDRGHVRVRIFSSRKATQQEVEQYAE